MNKYTEDSIDTERIYYMVKDGEIYECKIKGLVFEIPNPISGTFFLNGYTDLDINRCPIFSFEIETHDDTFYVYYDHGLLCKNYRCKEHNFRDCDFLERIYPFLKDCTSNSYGLFYYRKDTSRFFMRPRVFVKDFMRRFKPTMTDWFVNVNNAALMVFYWDDVNLRTVFTKFTSIEKITKRHSYEEKLLFNLFNGEITLRSDGDKYYSSFEECEKNKDKVVIHRF